MKGNATNDKLKGKFRTLKMDTKLQGRKLLFTNLDIVFEPDEYNMGEIQYKADGSLTFERQLDLTGNVFLSPQVVKCLFSVSPNLYQSGLVKAVPASFHNAPFRILLGASEINTSSSITSLILVFCVGSCKPSYCSLSHY
jgi:hypothetical protein